MGLFQKLFGNEKKATTEETAQVANTEKSGRPTTEETAQTTNTEASGRPETVQDWCREFEDARARGDRDDMHRALLKAHAACKSKNSMCLTEMFCPDCPMGGLTVISGRAGM